MRGPVIGMMIACGFVVAGAGPDWRGRVDRACRGSGACRCTGRDGERHRCWHRRLTTALTGREGSYVFPGLLPGVYRVRVELSGFRPLTREGVRLATGETVRLDLQLEVGGLAEAVTVTADAPLLRSETSGLGHVIDNRKIVDLPLNGRSFITLASLAPGVALPPPPAAPFPRINGGRPRTNEYLFDGISVLQPEPGQVAFFPNIDAIQEFKIESNSPPAEFGRFNGGVVNLTTKSGGNPLRGSVFEFFRHEALNARNFFASPNPVKPQFRRNQFGGVVGGPDPPRPDVLLRRLPGPAADDRAHGHLHGADRAAAAGHIHGGDRRARAVPSTTRPRRRRDRRRRRRAPSSRATRFLRAGSIRWPARSWTAIRCRPAPGPPTTTAGWPTKPWTRTSSACAWTTGFPRTAIRCSAV